MIEGIPLIRKTAWSVSLTFLASIALLVYGQKLFSSNIKWVTDKLVDSDGDGKADKLVFEVGVELMKPGVYRLAVTTGRAGGPNLTAFSQAQLNAGSATIQVPVGAVRIVEEIREDGPYDIVLVRLELVTDEERDRCETVDELRNQGKTSSTVVLKAIDPGQGWLTGEVSAKGIDENGDPGYELLRVRAAALVPKGRCEWLGMLFDTASRKVATAEAVGELAAGPQDLTLDFSGQEISKSGLDGPFSAQIHLSCGRGNSYRLLDVKGPVFRASEFERWNPDFTVKLVSELRRISNEYDGLTLEFALSAASGDLGEVTAAAEVDEKGLNVTKPLESTPSDASRFDMWVVGKPGVVGTFRVRVKFGSNGVTKELEIPVEAKQWRMPPLR